MEPLDFITSYSSSVKENKDKIKSENLINENKTKEDLMIDLTNKSAEE